MRAVAPPRTLDWLDRRFIRLMRAHGLLLLRLSLGLVFVWFGALKLAGRSPVERLVASVVPWFPPAWVVPALGGWEVLVGLGLLAGAWMRVTLFLFWLQMAGTFLVLLLLPGVAFRDGNPLLLTTEGEFVVKNLVLVSAGIALGGTVLRPREREEGKVVTMRAATPRTASLEDASTSIHMARRAERFPPKG